MATRAFALLFLLLMSFSAFPAEVAGVRIEDRDRVANAELVLNGAGLRKRAFFQVYAAGLYLAEKKGVAAEAIAAAGPKRVAIHMLRNVDAQTFTGALADGIRDNHGEAEAKAFEPRVKQLGASMAQVGEAKEGMRITLDWVPATGTVLGVNGKPAGSPIAGEDFYRALLRVWLGDNPADRDLKKGMLGG